MLYKLRKIYLCLLACTTFAGCATVNPTADYRLSGKYVTEATGYTTLYVPGEDETVAKKVAELLAGGLTADKAAQIALLNNRRLQAALFSIGIRRADVVQSGLLSNPSLGASIRFPSGGGLANINAGVAQNIAELWRLPVRKRAAEHDLQRAILNFAQVASSLALETKSVYYHAVTADRQKQITTENLKISRKLLDLAIARQEAGVGSIVDVTLSRSEFRETQADLQEAELSSFEARSTLVSKLDLTQPPEQLLLQEVLPDPPDWILSIDQLFTLAQKSRLDVISAKEAVISNAARLELERQRVWPLIEVGLEFERESRSRSSRQDILEDTAVSSLRAGMFTLPEFILGEEKHSGIIVGPSFNVELPIFDQNQAQIAKAEYILYQSEKILEAIIREVLQDTRLAYERSLSAWSMARFYRDELLPLRETSLDLAHEAYQVGKVSFLFVLEAQRTLLTARAKYVQALAQSALVQIDLEKVTGRPILDILAEENNTEDKNEN